ncbi:hypothetical protein ACQB6R_08330 [Propionibacteriaceae bacterium G1746]|uniref:hypothetical protein n=1 Tax=Aestuariimicrobium sp. G57 TaxID=3418485 RepID=UPI003C1E2107
MTTDAVPIDPTGPGPQPAPVTGDQRVDAALRQFGTLADHAPADHQARLDELAKVLAQVLESPAHGAGMPGGMPRPAAR